MKKIWCVYASRVRRCRRCVFEQYFDAFFAAMDRGVHSVDSWKQDAS